MSHQHPLGPMDVARELSAEGYDLRDLGTDERNVYWFGLFKLIQRPLCIIHPLPVILAGECAAVRRTYA